MESTFFLRWAAMILLGFYEYLYGTEEKYSGKGIWAIGP